MISEVASGGGGGDGVGKEKTVVSLQLLNHSARLTNLIKVEGKFIIASYSAL